MSHLKLYWPELQEASLQSAHAVHERQVLPFEPLSRRFDVAGNAGFCLRLQGSPAGPQENAGSRMRAKPPMPAGAADPLQRARIIYRNRRCPTCNRTVVEPLDLCDGIRNSGGMEIPGTSTLVGFFCHACDSEWSH